MVEPCWPEYCSFWACASIRTGSQKSGLRYGCRIRCPRTSLSHRASVGMRSPSFYRSEPDWDAPSSGKAALLHPDTPQVKILLGLGARNDSRRAPEFVPRPIENLARSEEH